MADIDARPAATRLTVVEDAEITAAYTGAAAATSGYRPTRRSSITDTSRASAQRAAQRAPGRVNRRGFEETAVSTPQRVVTVNDQLVEADLDVVISTGVTGPPAAEITLYNLAPSTWASISRSTPITVHLGWQSIGTEPVFDGHVLTKRPRRQQADSKHVLWARGTGHRATAGELSASFVDVAPHRIVEQVVAATDGLGRGHIADGTRPLQGSYSLTTARAIADWLDALASKAQRQTGQRWVWFTERGDLSFHPTDERVTDDTVFALGKSGLRATPSGQTAAEGVPDPHELVTRCEPVVRRGMTVRLEGTDTVDPESRFRVANYAIDSSTTTGRHHTTAELEPLARERSRQEAPL